MKYRCTYLAIAFCGMLAASFVGAAQDKVVQDKSSQGKTALVVDTFTAAPSMAWPYDMKLLQTETVAELRAKDGQKFNIGAEAAADGTPGYRLQGEVTEWHPGNRHDSLLVGDRDGEKGFRPHRHHSRRVLGQRLRWLGGRISAPVRRQDSEATE